MTSEQRAAFEDAQLEWSECMREHGIEVPDIDDGPHVIVVGEVGTAADGDPQSDGPSITDVEPELFEEAIAECDAAFEAIGVSSVGSAQ